MNENKYGAIIRPTRIRDYDYGIVCKATNSNLPDKYTIDKKNIPDVHDQGSTNRCVAYTLCECAEAYVKKHLDDDRHFSETWTYGRKENRNNYTGEGMYVDTAVKGSSKIGFADRAYLDFMADVPFAIELAAERDDLLPVAKKIKPSAYANLNYALEDKKWDSIRRAIYDYNLPIVLASRKFFKGGTHCILGIGWSDEYKGKKRRCIEFQNSWGTEYGDNGRSFIPLDYIDEAYVLLWNNIKIPFTDVKEKDWFYKDVRNAYFSGYMNGVSEDKFFPNDNMIRGDVAVVISRLIDKIEYSVNSFLKGKEQEGEKVNYIRFYKPYSNVTFTDVNDEDYYSEAIYHVYANDFMHGEDKNLFDPTAAITRAEFAAALVRVLMDVTYKMAKCIGRDDIWEFENSKDFADVSENDWYYQEVYDAVRLGLMNGVNDTDFEPERNITRAEGAAVICRLFKKIEDLFDKL